MDVNSSEAHPYFPSGIWEGFYTYTNGSGGSQHTMKFSIDFNHGRVNGSGGDDVGSFSWNGTYDANNCVCFLNKNYATHEVNYNGYADENGIWGTWNLSGIYGGFHIWPSGKNESSKEADKLEKVKLISTSLVRSD